MAQKEAFFAPAVRLHSVCMLLVLRRVTTLRERRKRVLFLLKNEFLSMFVPSLSW